MTQRLRDGAPAGGPSRSIDLRRVLVDSPASLGAKARQKRWEQFARTFPEISQFSVLDLGGTADSWMRAPVRPRHVTVLNLTEPGESNDWLRAVSGDACLASSELKLAGAAGSYDLVFSNSLIEHVGGHARRVQLAAHIHELAPAHWIQTPYRYFPLEPHWLCPGMQFLPLRARQAVALRWPLAHTRSADAASALDDVLWTELLTQTEMRKLFPTSDIYRERTGGLVKSISAVRTGG